MGLIAQCLDHVVPRRVLTPTALGPAVNRHDDRDSRVLEAWRNGRVPNQYVGVVGVIGVNRFDLAVAQADAALTIVSYIHEMGVRAGLALGGYEVSCGSVQAARSRSELCKVHDPHFGPSYQGVEINALLRSTTRSEMLTRRSDTLAQASEPSIAVKWLQKTARLDRNVVP